VSPDDYLVDPSLAHDVLRAALARGGSFAEVFVEERSSLGVRLDDGRIEELDSGLDRGAGVRVVQGPSTGYAFSNGLDRESLLEVAEAAAASVRMDEPGRVVDLTGREPGVRHEVERPASGVPAEEKVRWLREADDAARSFDPAIAQVVAGYGDSLQRVMIAASDGRLVREDRHRIRLVVQVVASRDGVLQIGFNGPALVAGTEYIERFPPRDTAAEAARQAVAMLDGVPAPAGEMPVVIGPGGGGVLFHEACGHGLEADLIQKESSIYRGRVGELLATPLLNGVDDATVPNAWGSFSFDDEGWPSQRTTLFTEGVLRSYLYDRIRSDHDGVPSTGNGRRQSYAHLPIPRMTNTYILSGDATADQVVADTPNGFYARRLGGGQVNPATGDFVFGVTEGYLIEHGEITHPVRGANLVGNGTDILQGIDVLADDFDVFYGICGKEGQGVPVGNGSPTLRISRMTVGGTG
jgi:TldD protein